MYRRVAGNVAQCVELTNRVSLRPRHNSLGGLTVFLVTRTERLLLCEIVAVHLASLTSHAAGIRDDGATIGAAPSMLGSLAPALSEASSARNALTGPCVLVNAPGFMSFLPLWTKFCNRALTHQYNQLYVQMRMLRELMSLVTTAYLLA